MAHGNPEGRLSRCYLCRKGSENSKKHSPGYWKNNRGNTKNSEKQEEDHEKDE